MVKMLNVPLLSLIITAISITSASSTLISIDSTLSSDSLQCLTVKGARFKNGTPVVLNTCGDNIQQQWEVSRASLSSSDSTDITIKDPSSESGVKFCLDAKTVVDTSPVVIWECNQNPWQKWRFTASTRESSRRLQLDDTSANLCLETPNNSGLQVHTSTCSSDRSQDWRLELKA